MENGEWGMGNGEWEIGKEESGVIARSESSSDEAISNVSG
jgi:hypothetical protein